MGGVGSHARNWMGVAMIVCAATTSCGAAPPAHAVSATVDGLLDDPSGFDGKTLKVTGTVVGIGGETRLVLHIPDGGGEWSGALPGLQALEGGGIDARSALLLKFSPDLMCQKRRFEKAKCGDLLVGKRYELWGRFIGGNGDMFESDPRLRPRLRVDGWRPTP